MSTLSLPAAVVGSALSTMTLTGVVPVPEALPLLSNPFAGTLADCANTADAVARQRARASRAALDEIRMTEVLPWVDVSGPIGQVIYPGKPGRPLDAD